MDTHKEKFKIRLGMFIAGGLALFVISVFIIGKQKNLFNPVFKASAKFSNVSGLQVGNNIRFSGINVGIVDHITIINDSTVKVDMLIRKEVRQFIKSDCEVGIGSEGLIGDRLLMIGEGSTDSPMVRIGQELPSTEPVETDAIMASLKVTAGHAEVISEQLAEIVYKVNNGHGILSKLIQDSSMAFNLDQTMLNLNKSTKGLDENMQAAKHNFLLKGYFNKLEKEKEKKAKAKAPQATK
jgi:phospholipid/cholesterol/gamma-HCH transport system substrate-binding protein